MDNCRFRRNGTCLIVNLIVGESVEVHDSACKFCAKQHPEEHNRRLSKPVSDHIRHGLRGKSARDAAKARPLCVHIGEKIKANPDRPLCGACATYECEAGVGGKDGVRPDRECLMCEPAPVGLYVPRDRAFKILTADEVAGDSVTIRTKVVQATSGDGSGLRGE